MSFLKLLGALVMTGASIGILVVDYTSNSRFGRVALFGIIVANVVILLEHCRNYRKGNLLKAEIEENAVRITDWLTENSPEFAQNGVSERSLARGAGLSTEQARTAIDRLESRELVVRDPVATEPHFLVRPGRSWTSSRSARRTHRDSQPK
jgi:hypothetical protein